MTRKPKESDLAHYQKSNEGARASGDHKSAQEEKPQIDKFRELAREIETVDSEEPLNAALRKVAKAPPPRHEEQKKKEE
ncbi:hypothetical protein FJ492_04360 [Mesorhizobium sp. B2-5-4]|uniref:hypothetical protein n=1 Tax=Mesorhizobium sp. B2-5-4 TaxID=2589926 RepID=UPI00112E23E9|nr:hypothetical protein [Mesorhizobium sp. B2-5-4]TPK48926.1 hypothetical protein FJ492_04360 [Mesorhizobium sp. B2-5-4]